MNNDSSEELTTHDKLLKRYYEKNRGTLVQLIRGKKPEIESEIIKKFKRLYPDIEVSDVKSLFWEGYNKALDNIVREDNADAFNRGYNYAHEEMNDIDDYTECEDVGPLDIDEINAKFEQLANEDADMYDRCEECMVDYQSGFNDGYSDGYSKGYEDGQNAEVSYYNDAFSNENYDEGYKDGYEAGLEARPSDDSAFNGYYGIDGGFHEYNNGWESE